MIWVVQLQSIESIDWQKEKETCVTQSILIFDMLFSNVVHRTAVRPPCMHKFLILSKSFIQILGGLLGRYDEILQEIVQHSVL